MTTTVALVTMRYKQWYLFYFLLDVNECATANGNCDQDCHNTNGSYYCTCDSGWRLDPDGHTCNGDDRNYSITLCLSVLFRYK